MGILSFLGLVFLAIIFVFVWQTYIKGDVDFATQHIKRKPENKQQSLRGIASGLGCSPLEARERYIEHLIEVFHKSESLGQNALKLLEKSINELENKKLIEATKYKINPEDTSSAILSEWSKELLQHMNESSVKPISKLEVIKTTEQPSPPQKINPIDTVLTQANISSHNKTVSLGMLAETLKCSIDEVKEYYFRHLENGFKQERASPERAFDILKALVLQLIQEKQKEAEESEIEADDTPSGILQVYATDMLLSVREQPDMFDYSIQTNIDGRGTSENMDV